MHKLIALVALTACTISSHAVQLVLAPSNVVGTSGSYSANFPASFILNQQVGGVTDVSRTTYWLNADNSGSTQVYITVDLGASYQLDELVLFNTHNDGFNDRGTGSFTIVGANAVVDTGGGNLRITGPQTTLVSGALPAATSTVPSANLFDVTDPNAFRYLSFQPTSVAAPGTPSSSTAYGLNELRVFVSAVPEPSTTVFMVFGAAVVGWVARRRLI